MSSLGSPLSHDTLVEICFVSYARFDKQYANGSEDETRSEYEGKVEYAGFQNPHDGFLPELS
jgi:hypothetical protein